MNLVIVESPAKAKTINKYLGDNYTVLASYGHIRDLPSKKYGFGLLILILSFSGPSIFYYLTNIWS